MKKSLLAIAFALVSMAGSAQIYVGGSLGFNSTAQKSSYDGTKLSHDTHGTFTFAPEVGWAMNETLSFGLTINYASSSYKNKIASSSTKTTTSTWNLKPYARYTFHTIGNVSCFADGVLGFGIPEKDWTYLSIAVRPGIAVDITENISLISTIDLLGWGSNFYSKDKTKASRSSFDLISNASVGVFYTF